MIAGYALTENEDNAVKNTICKVDGAGVPEVNGEYKFHSIKHDAGFYIRRAEYNGKAAKFTLYKCSLSNGGYQWFISITPEEMEPGVYNIHTYIYTYIYIKCIYHYYNGFQIQGVRTTWTSTIPLRNLPKSCHLSRGIA